MDGQECPSYGNSEIMTDTMNADTIHPQPTTTMIAMTPVASVSWPMNCVLVNRELKDRSRIASIFARKRS